jgi:DMSO/TMAO reductase YedYZ heme-binding membrane subunit
MKTYFKIIQFIQKFSLGISILLMLTLPIILVFYPEKISESTTLRLYDLSHIAVLFVMIIRPLADIFTKTKLIRPLVILRKGLGVFSAAIIVSFIFSKIIIDPAHYFSSLITLKYWSLDNFALFAHLADISAIVLIATSNNFSKRILGSLWKKVQKLSYLYFYASSFYVFVVFENSSVLLSMFIVTALTMLAHVVNQKRIINQSQQI